MFPTVSRGRPTGAAPFSRSLQTISRRWSQKLQYARDYNGSPTNVNASLSGRKHVRGRPACGVIQPPTATGGTLQDGDLEKR